MDIRYKERRAEIERVFDRAELVSGSQKEYVSPSKEFVLKTEVYSTGQDTWAYSRGKVYATESDRLIADIKRNHSAFWYAWVQHPNGFEYLLCGEDYQGYTSINLTDGTLQSHFPKEGYNGMGFCWAKVFPSPNGKLLAVDGCYWACPYDLVLYDFIEPESLPLKEVLRVEALNDSIGWKDDNTFLVSREVEYRKSDGTPYDTLNDEEQEWLDNDPNLVDFMTETIEVKVPSQYQ